MKQTENNEIDLLLRGLARRDGARSVAPEDRSAMHLDADELNSYAEQALPAAARARYTSHLAECSSCRKIVSELTLASGATVSESPISQKTSGFRQKLGALFSPGLLRYAVPALALFAFVAVGLFVLRQQTQPEFVAVNQPAASSDTTIATKQADAPAEPRTSAVAEELRSPESPTSATKGRDNQAKADEKKETSNKETSNIATATDSVTVTSERDASAGKAAGAVAQPSYAPEPAAPPAPKPQTTQTESRAEVASRQKEADKKDEPAREQEGARARTDDNQNQVARPQSGTGALLGQSQEKLRKLEARRANETVAKGKDEEEADIRTVSGRRFKRQRGVWIDTAYQSSTATTSVSRGSEQFRALVADEPGIRAIAAQLTGEVVVVWKGRAYRIR